MRDSVPKIVHATDPSEEHFFVPHLHPRKGPIGKDRPDGRPVLGSQEIPPEPETQLRHDSFRRDLPFLLLDSSPGSSDVLLEPRTQQPMRIVVPIGAVTLADRPLGHRRVDRVAKDDFYIRKYFEESSGNCGVPLVQPDGSLEVTIA